MMITTLPVEMCVREVMSKGSVVYHTLIHILAISDDRGEVTTSMNFSVLICKMGITIKLILQGRCEVLKQCYT